MAGTRMKLWGSIAESARAALWFWPTVAAVGALALALVLVAVRAELVSVWPVWVNLNDADAARAALQVVATSIITAATLTISLTVVALQLAAQQFSPRLLREFARDRVIQGVLALLVSTVVMALTGLLGVQDGEEIPVMLVGIAVALGLCSVIGLVVFVGHIVRTLRVETLMVRVHDEAKHTIDRLFPDYDDHDSDAHRDVDPAAMRGRVLAAERSGFVRVVRVKKAVGWARKHEALVLMLVTPGDHVTVGAPVAVVRSPHEDPPLHALSESVVIDFERTKEADPGLALRQLVDIAVKAISPSINDPATAADAVGHCGDLLVQLQGRNLAPRRHDDDDGVARLITASHDYRRYLSLVLDPIRHYGRSDLTVLDSLLRMLRELARSARDDRQRGEVARQLELVLDAIAPDMQRADRDELHRMAERVRIALGGDELSAYIDDPAGNLTD